MRKVLLAALIALVVPTASQAQFQLGARLGFAPAMGDALKDVSMKDGGAKSQIPFQLDALYKVNADIGVGAYFSYGIGQVDCDPGSTCSVNVMRVGAQATYAFNTVKAPLVPWAGVGIGYEIASGEEDGVDGSLSGMEYLNLQVGGDYKVNEQFSVGPYLMFSIGQYASAESGGTSVSIPSDQKALHQWFGFGVAGKFNL